MIQARRINRLVDTARSADIAGIARARGIRLSGKKNLFGPCPFCGGTDRFSISIVKQAYNCRVCGAGGYGAISFVNWLDGSGFIEAVKTITGEQVIKQDNRQHQDHERAQHEKAKWLWHRRQPIAGTVAERYLRDARGYQGPLPQTLAFLPALKPGQHTKTQCTP